MVEDAPDMGNVEGIFELGEGGVMDAEWILLQSNSFY